MLIEKLDIEGVLIIQPSVFEDARGYFYESYNKTVFQAVGIDYEFVQDNQSLSQKGVLRGLHFQNPPFSQGKLVRVIQGAVQDVVVDIRKNSSTYGEYFSVVLTGENKKMFWIPPGFAHGFLTLENNTIFSYKCTNAYNKNAEDAILWSDKDLGIKWEFSNPLVSDKDKIAQSFKSLKPLF